MEHFDIWKFLAGLGIFMFGIFLMEESIRQLSGKAFKRLIRLATKNRFTAILTGIGVTAVLQSSSAVSLMTIAFAGAGIMGMENAIGVVMGTNVGTTFTAWLVAMLGFKVSIESLALHMLGIGGLGLIFLASSPRFSGISKLLVGFGFLFMGIDYMKVSVEGFAAQFDLTTLPHYSTWFYVLVGLLITAAMQSSSATIAIILTTLNSGVIQFNEGAAMVIGANIGTTITIILGSLGGVQIKKQVAFSHFLFNFLTAFVAYFILPYYVTLIVFFAPDHYSDVLGIAWFHTFFNLMGVVLFFPFIPLLVKWLRRLFPEKSAPNTLFIQNVSVDLPEASLNALKRETRHLYSLTLILLEHLVHVKHTQYVLASDYKYFADHQKQNPATDSLHQIDKLRKLHAEIAAYAIKIKQQELEVQDVKQLHQLIHVAMGLQQLIQLATGLLDDRENLKESSNNQVQEILRQLHQRFSGYLREYHYEWAEGHQFLNMKLSPDLLSQRLETEYDQFISQVSAMLSEGKIESRHATALLSLNGLLTQCFRQVYKLFEPFKQVQNQLINEEVGQRFQHQ